MPDSRPTVRIDRDGDLWQHRDGMWCQLDPILYSRTEDELEGDFGPTNELVLVPIDEYERLTAPLPDDVQRTVGLLRAAATMYGDEDVLAGADLIGRQSLEIARLTDPSEGNGTRDTAQAPPEVDTLIWDWKGELDKLRRLVRAWRAQFADLTPADLADSPSADLAAYVDALDDSAASPAAGRTGVGERVGEPAETAEEMVYEFIPPAARYLPEGALDAATRGAAMLDASILSRKGRNLLAHALVELDRAGWFRSPARTEDMDDPDMPTSSVYTTTVPGPELPGMWDVADLAGGWADVGDMATSPEPAPRPAQSHAGGQTGPGEGHRTEADMLIWDWKEQPDLDDLTAILGRRGVRLTQVDTGGDKYEIRISGADECPTLAQVLATDTGSHDDSVCGWCADLRAKREAARGRLRTFVFNAITRTLAGRTFVPLGAREDVARAVVDALDCAADNRSAQ